MSSSGLSQLNNGLARVVSERSYPKVRQQYVQGQTKGRVFRVGVLHRKELTEEVLLRNRRGYTNAQLNTVAHAPSLYHWLFHRCGIPFAEAQQLVRRNAVKVDDVVVTNLRDLESQLEWDTFQDLDIQVRSFLPSVVRQAPADASTSASSTSSASDGVWVPALKRALHRSYHFIFLYPGVSISSAEDNPKSFVHRMTPHLGAQSTVSALGLNVLRPIGFMDSMKGFGIASNDVSMLRYWNNESMGNFGGYDVRFVRGTPPEVVRAALQDVQRALNESVKPHLPAVNIKIPCSCSLEKVPPASMDVVRQLFTRTTFTEERILVSTPLFPYRIARRLRKAGGFITLTRSGPFSLSPSLSKEHIRPLSTEELALLFTFERRLKTNRMIMTLQEFDSAGADEN